MCAVPGQSEGTGQQDRIKVVSQALIKMGQFDRVGLPGAYTQGTLRTGHTSSCIFELNLVQCPGNIVECCKCCRSLFLRHFLLTVDRDVCIYLCFNITVKGQMIVEEVPQNMYCIPSAAENIIMEMPQKIRIYTFSAALGHNGISIIIFSSAPALECIFSDTW